MRYVFFRQRNIQKIYDSCLYDGLLHSLGFSNSVAMFHFTFPGLNRNGAVISNLINC